MNDNRHKTEDFTNSREGGTDMPAGKGGGAGEDEGSAPVDGADEHLKDEQKPTSK